LVIFINEGYVLAGRAFGVVGEGGCFAPKIGPVREMDKIKAVKKVNHLYGMPAPAGRITTIIISFGVEYT
jgi:hypothetical protein